MMYLFVFDNADTGSHCQLQLLSSGCLYMSVAFTMCCCSSCRNFFEMVRFDFILDEHLNVYLLEVCEHSLKYYSAHDGAY